MHMKADEIVMRYRQAKHKGEQLKILADLNACSVDDIITVLCENSNGQYKRSFFNTAKKKIDRLEKTAEVLVVEDDKTEEQPIVSQSDTPGKRLVDSALDIIRAELADIRKQQYRLDMRKAALYQELQEIFWDFGI